MLASPSQESPETPLVIWLLVFSPQAWDDV